MRAQVKAYIVATLEPLLPQSLEHPVEVSNGWPGKNLGRNHVWVDRVTGTASFRFIEAGTKTCDDEFTVRIICQASAPGDSIAECDERAESYADALIEMIATDPSLDDMNGVIHAHFTDSSKEGPMGEFTDEGAVSFCFVDLAVHTRT